MAEGLVRVRESVGGKAETIRVSREHVEEYLRAHPGASVVDPEWRPLAELPKAGKPEAERK